MHQSAAPVGLYGKLPCKGDFLQRRVSQEFVDAWDPWLQECLQASREQLAEEWLQHYLTSPVWRFVLTEGVCGTGAYAGVMVPSVDRVGRYFPLTVVAELAAEDCPIEVACDATDWFDAVEARAVAALQTPQLDLESFDAEIAELACLLTRPAASEAARLLRAMLHEEFARTAARQWQVPLAAAHSLRSAVYALASRELLRGLRPLALWWSDGSRAAAPSWLSTRGLPSSTSFAGMLTGRWRAAGWTSLAMEGIPEQPPDASLVDPLATAPAHSATAEPTHVPDGAPGASALQPIEVIAWYPPLTRIGNVPTVQFVARPEASLWAVTSAEDSSTDGGAALLVADALHSVPAGATLTALAENVRLALEGGYRQLALHDSSAASHLATVVFVTHGSECAIVWTGGVQVVQCRSRVAGFVVGSSAASSELDAESAPDTAPSGSLMELVAAPVSSVERAASAGPDHVFVQYEPLRAGDVWVLLAAPLLEPAQLPALAAAVSGSAADYGGSALGESWETMAARGFAQIGSGESALLPVIMLAACSALAS
jgi:type VI secretion system protein ImpM